MECIVYHIWQKQGMNMMLMQQTTQHLLISATVASLKAITQTCAGHKHHSISTINRAWRLERDVRTGLSTVHGVGHSGTPQGARFSEVRESVRWAVGRRRGRRRWGQAAGGGVGGAHTTPRPACRGTSKCLQKSKKCLKKFLKAKIKMLDLLALLKVF